MSAKEQAKVRELAEKYFPQKILSAPAMAGGAAWAQSSKLESFVITVGGDINETARTRCTDALRELAEWIEAERQAGRQE